jgi:hypothetical protein
MTDLSSIRVGGGRVSAHPETSKQSSTAHPAGGLFPFSGTNDTCKTQQIWRKAPQVFFTLVSVFFVVNSTL